MSGWAVKKEYRGRLPFFNLGPGVFEGNSAVENRRVRRGLDVDAEVAETLELESAAWRSSLQAWFDSASRESFQGLWIEVCRPIMVCRDFRKVSLEQRIVETNLGFNGMACRYPMDRGFHLSLRFGGTASCHRIVGAMQFADVTGQWIFGHAYAFNDIGVAEPDFPARCEPVKLLWWIFHKIVSFDIEGAGEGNCSRAGRGIFRVVHGL